LLVCTVSIEVGVPWRTSSVACTTVEFSDFRLVNNIMNRIVELSDTQTAGQQECLSCAECSAISSQNDTYLLQTQLAVVSLWVLAI